MNLYNEMATDTYNAIRRYNNVLNFALEVTSRKNKTPQWFKVEHRCPKCNKAITEWSEFEFTVESGECGTCDHVRGEQC